MAHDTEPEPDRLIPANDNQGPNGGQNEPDQDARLELDRVILTIARLIGRRIAREQFTAINAANENKPEDTHDAEDGADIE